MTKKLLNSQTLLWILSQRKLKALQKERQLLDQISLKAQQLLFNLKTWVKVLLDNQALQWDPSLKNLQTQNMTFKAWLVNLKKDKTKN
jgi:hypothetical protein